MVGKNVPLVVVGDAVGDMVGNDVPLAGDIVGDNVPLAGDNVPLVVVGDIVPLVGDGVEKLGDNVGVDKLGDKVGRKLGDKVGCFEKGEFVCFVGDMLG